MNGNAYRLPIEWNQLLKDVAVMQRDCGISYQALEDRGNKSRRINAPCRGVSTGVLRASKVCSGKPNKPTLSGLKHGLPTSWMILRYDLSLGSRQTEASFLGLKSCVKVRS